MKRKAVKSSNIAEVGYDGELVMEIKFNNGSVYQYEPIRPSGYKAFMAAESLGGYFYKNIRNNPDINCTQIE